MAWTGAASGGTALCQRESYASEGAFSGGARRPTETGTGAACGFEETACPCPQRQGQGPGASQQAAPVHDTWAEASSAASAVKTSDLARRPCPMGPAHGTRPNGLGPMDASRWARSHGPRPYRPIPMWLPPCHVGHVGPSPWTLAQSKRWRKATPMPSQAMRNNCQSEADVTQNAADAGGCSARWAGAVGLSPMGQGPVTPSPCGCHLSRCAKPHH